MIIFWSDNRYLYAYTIGSNSGLKTVSTSTNISTTTYSSFYLPHSSVCIGSILLDDIKIDQVFLNRGFGI